LAADGQSGNFAQLGAKLGDVCAMRARDSMGSNPVAYMVETLFSFCKW
jgi:hypothetical protein